MAEDDEDYGPTITRRRLGLLMESLRVRRGLSLGEAAEAIEVSAASLSRIENGHQSLSVHVAKSMLDVYEEVDRYHEILQLCRDSQRKGWWHAYGIHGRNYVSWEADAEFVRTFQVQLVPGLLQSAEYARALIEAQREVCPEQIDNAIKVRMIRQRRLRHGSRPLRLEAILHEAALRTRVGGLEVMYGQLVHMAELAELPTVSLRVLPLATGATPSMTGGFVILAFPRQILPDTLYIEHAFGSTDTEKREEVHRAKVKFGRLREQSLDERSTLDFLARLAEELE